MDIRFTLSLLLGAEPIILFLLFSNLQQHGNNLYIYFEILKVFTNSSITSAFQCYCFNPFTKWAILEAYL